MQKHQGLGSHISITSQVFKFDEHKLQPNTLQFPPGNFLLVCAAGLAASSMGHAIPHITLYFLDLLLLLRMLTLGQYQVPVL